MNHLKVAKTNSTNSKLTAYCVAKASMLALICNTLVVPGGLVSLVLLFHLAWYQNAVAIPFLLIIGAILAVTVDGMTLGSCARLRKTFETRIAIKKHYSQIVEKEREIEEAERRELEALRPSYIVNSLFIAVFSIISMGAGELLWHTLLQALPVWLSWPIASLFSIAVSATLISSELLKAQNEQVIAQSIQSSKFHKLAFDADAEEEALDLLHQEYISQVKELKENTPTISATVEEKVKSIYNDILFDGRDVIQMRIEADTLAQERIEEKRLARVKAQQEMLSAPKEKNTDELLRIDAPKYRRLGNADRVRAVVEKYGEPHVRANIGAICEEIGLSRAAIYQHLRQFKQA